MSLVDKSVSPYFDDFDPTKGYTQILQVAGRYLQTRELTQAQTMMYYYLKRLSDVILKNGDIIAGMSYSLSGTTLTVTSGQVYLGGRIIDFPQQTITITGTGVENIGVKLNEVIVTENDDTTLRNPATGTKSYGLAGAHRIKASPILTLNDTDSPTIYQFVNGVLKIDPAKPQIDALMQTLAKRTYDEAGNFRVRGLDLYTSPFDANNIQLTVEAGLAYVMGYQVLKPAPVKVNLPLSTATRSATSEPKVYHNGTTLYPLNNSPVQSITKVVAQVSTTSTMTKGAVTTGIDYLPKTPVVSITSVTAGATTYVQGTDYKLTSDGVDWSLPGAKPTAGSTYTVTYVYNKTMVAGTDYNLYTTTDSFGNSTDNVQFLSGDKPVDSSTFNVDYLYYLARVDTISLDKGGNIIVTTGQSDLARLVNPPAVLDPSLLKLGTVYLPPNSSNAVATGGSTTRLSMEDLQKLADRLKDVEYNQAVTALDRQAMDGELPTNLKGIFSDSFRSTEKGDLTNPLFSVMYSLEDGTILLPPNTTNTFVPTISQATSNINSFGRIISAPMTEVVKVNQPYATGSMLINPYLAFSTNGRLKLNPAFDNWIDTSTITIEKQASQARNFYRWWKYAKLKDKVDDLFASNIKLQNGQPLSSWRGGVGASTVAVKTDKSVQAINEAITYMRQISVTFTAENLIPNSDNLQLYFDGVVANITPSAGFSAGTIAGSIKSNASGVAQGTFTIPANIRTGTREVVLKNANTQSKTTFTSIGTKRTLRETVLKTKIQLTIVDPLAQTFQFDQDQVLTSVGFFLAGVDSTKNLVVQIRNVENGYPSNVVYAEKVISPASQTASADASVETKVTFDDPVHCKANTQYCLVIQSDSATPSIYIAELGKKDIKTGTQVSYQPYLAGLLFSSKNGVAWTAHQNANMKFKLYTASFQPTGVVEFNPITGLSADRILLLADYLTPQNTGCYWEIKLDGGTYQPITSYEDMDLNIPVNQIQLRATFNSSENLSPLMPIDGFTFIGFISTTSGSYIGRNVTGFDRNINNVKMIFDGAIPVGSTITPQFSVDGGTTWRTPTQTSATPLDSNFSQYTFSLAVPDTDNARQFRARINITANSAVLRPRVRRLMCICT